MIYLIFFDYFVCEYQFGIIGLEVVVGIFKLFVKKVIVMVLDGELVDLFDLIYVNVNIEIVICDDLWVLEFICYDVVYVMVEVVQELWLGIQVIIGLVMENGFYYDFKCVYLDICEDWLFMLDDLFVIEKCMCEIIVCNELFIKEVWICDQVKDVFVDMGEVYKVELVDVILEDQDIKIYCQGKWFDLCCGLYMVLMKQIGDVFKLMKVVGVYWCGDFIKLMLI